MIVLSEGTEFIVILLMGQKQLWRKMGRGRFHAGMKIQWVKDL